MKEKNDHAFMAISSFSDFAIERKRLKLKRKLIETRFQFYSVELKEKVSLIGLLSFDHLEDLLQKIPGILGKILRSESRVMTNDNASETAE